LNESESQENSRTNEITEFNSMSMDSDVRKKISQKDMVDKMASNVNSEYNGYLNRIIKPGMKQQLSKHSSLSYYTAKGGAKSTSLIQGVAITEEDDDDDYSGQIRIKINKNKQILNHLARFTKDIGSAIGTKDGMTLLFYDFNGTKSSLSTRNNHQHVNTTQNDSLSEKFMSGGKEKIK
jgi:hypothetical protein